MVVSIKWTETRKLRAYKEKRILEIKGTRTNVIETTQSCGGATRPCHYNVYNTSVEGTTSTLRCSILRFYEVTTSISQTTGTSPPIERTSPRAWNKFSNSVSTNVKFRIWNLVGWGYHCPPNNRGLHVKKEVGWSWIVSEISFENNYYFFLKKLYVMFF